MESPMHVVICPWLAFGHLLPCLELAQRLASRGHRVSLVSSLHNIARLPAVEPLVDLVALTLPREDGLANGAESTHDVPFEKIDHLRMASDGLAVPFSSFLDSMADKPDWIVVEDHWAAAVAVQHKVPCAMLLLFSATMVAAMDVRLSESRWDPEAPRFEQEAIAKMVAVQGPSSGMSIDERVSLMLQRSSLVAVRSCFEWEPEMLPLVATFGGKPVVPLGLLPPSPDRRGNDDDNDAAVRWLDARPAVTVVYVALGSEVRLGAEEVRELALGLELTGKPFLWALRKPVGGDDLDLLPPGFQERTRGHGLVVTGWVPQLRLLAHHAVAAFLTHCGWGSTIEGLMFGRPLVMLPIRGDQGPNARLMERRAVGVQVPRDQDDGSFHRDGVAAAVLAVVAVEEEGGRVFATNAKKMQAIAADTERHERYIDGFIQHLRSFKAEGMHRGCGVESMLPRLASPLGVESTGPEQGQAVLPDIPVIDMSSSDAGSRMAEAAMAWGIFQVVNHGVPASAVSELQRVGRQFFALPQEEKQRYAMEPSSGKTEGYGSTLQRDVPGGNKTWSEFLFHNVAPPSAVNHTVWPENPEGYREANEAFCAHMLRLTRTLLDRLSTALGLEEGAMAEALGGHDGVVLLQKINFYPPCPQPELTHGVAPHTDLSALTVLLPNEVPGLQVSRDGRWYDVDYVPGALIVHIGDQIEILTNGKYKAVLHRTTVSKDKTRMSWPVFVEPPAEHVVGPIVIADSPAKHEARKFKDYKINKLTK